MPVGSHWWQTSGESWPSQVHQHSSAAPQLLLPDNDGNQIYIILATTHATGLQLVFDPNRTIYTRHHPLWDVMIAGLPRCPVWCLLVTVPTDPFTTFTRPTAVWIGEVPTWNTQNGGTILPIANPLADSELVSPVSYSSFLVTTGLSLSFGDIRVWQTDRQCGTLLVVGQLINDYLLHPSFSLLDC